VQLTASKLLFSLVSSIFEQCPFKRAVYAALLLFGSSVITLRLPMLALPVSKVREVRWRATTDHDNNEQNYDILTMREKREMYFMGFPIVECAVELCIENLSTIQLR
jgi:hypothetical protein